MNDAYRQSMAQTLERLEAARRMPSDTAAATTFGSASSQAALAKGHHVER
jgi:hypothetical protein